MSRAARTVPATPSLPAATVEAEVVPTARPGLHMAVIALGIFLAALDQTVVVTALWPIAQDLQVPITELDRAAWVVTAYLLGYTVALPLMGRVADVFGMRRVYVFSLGLFMLGSLLCALAPTLGWLVAARALQAVGGGAVLPVGMAMARHLFGEKRVPFVLGLLGGVAEAGGVIGPLWGAFIMKVFNGFMGLPGWHWIFYVNIPLGLLFALLALRTGVFPRYTGRIDWPGAAMLAAGLTALSLALATPGSVGAWAGLTPSKSVADSPVFTPQMGLLLLLAAVLFAAFIWWQRRAPEPLISLDLFSWANRPYTAAILTNFLVGAALIITMVNVPFYVASVLDGTTEQGGLMLLRMTAFIPVGAVAGGFAGVRLPYRWIAAAGLALCALGFFEMSGWTTTSAGYGSTWLGLALNGAGFGLMLSPVTATALSWGGLRRAAFSAALVNLARMVGMMVSLSALTALGLRHFQALMSGHPAVILPNPGETAGAFARRQAEYTAFYKAASLEVYTRGFLIAGIVCLLAIAVALWLRRNPESGLEEGPIF